jgi:pyrroloquinoline quinone (PQQ) biosynthesis protein C
MSDTPETDAQLTTFTSISKLKKHFVNRTGTVSAEFARKLEQERDHWKRECLEQAKLLAMGADREEKLRTALQRLADCDWVISLPDRMDAVRKIAREALLQ